MEDIMIKLQQKQRRSSTSENYFKIWRAFNNFLVKLDRRPKTWEDRVALYCAYLTDEGAQSQTIKSYISAIKSVLRDDNYEWNENQVALSSLTRACKIVNDTVRTRLPIYCNLLETILFEVGRYFKDQPYLEILYKTMFLLGYYGLMRVGELTSGNHTVRAKDVFVGQNKQKLLIILYSSKTHDYGARPQKIKISGLEEKSNGNKSNRNLFFCPFKSVRKYMKAKGETYIDEEEPFFVFRDRSPVKPNHMRTILKKMIKRLGMDESLYDTHSLRIGRSSDLIRFGYTIDQVKLAGRWKSNAVYKYIRL